MRFGILAVSILMIGSARAEEKPLSPSDRFAELVQKYPGGQNARATWREAVAEFSGFVKSFPQERQLCARAFQHTARLCVDAGQPDLAVDKGLEFVREFSDQPQLCIEMLRTLAEWESYRQHYEAARRFLQQIQKDYSIYHSESAWAAFREAYLLQAESNRPAAMEKYRQVLKEYPDQKEIAGQTVLALADIYAQESAFDAAVAACEDFLGSLSPLHPSAVAIRLKIGEMRMRRGDFSNAISSFRNVLVHHPDHLPSCRKALQEMVIGLVQMDQIPEAFALARILRAVSLGDADAYAEAVDYVARVFKARDGHVATAKAFWEFCRVGPDGADGKPGTADDLKDPLPVFRLPPDAFRDRLFQSALAAQTADAEGFRRRGYLHLYNDRPEEAVKSFESAAVLAESGSSLAKVIAREREIARLAIPK